MYHHRKVMATRGASLVAEITRLPSVAVWLPIDANAERLVPVVCIEETAPGMILLSCNRDRFEAMKPFVETEYLREELPDYDHPSGGHWLWPHRVSQAIKTVEVNGRRIPHGELAVHRGARVDATDMFITHLVLKEGHLWGEKDVTISVFEIDHIEENTVHLRLDKRQVGALPTLPVHRS